MTATVEIPVCTKAHYQNGEIHIAYADGQKISFPISINNRLRGQSESGLNNIEITRFGLHWPDLDEDLSHEGLRAGRFGQP